LFTGAALGGEAAPIGAWWRTLPSAVQPAPMQVFEVREDGACITWGPEYMQDRASCTLRLGVISFRSVVNPMIGGEIPVSFQGNDHMAFWLGPPINQRQDWTRVSWSPFFESREVGGRSVAGNIGLLVRATVAASRAWRPDALPDRLQLRVMKNKEPEVTLDAYAPSDGAAVRYTITRYEIKTWPYQGQVGHTSKFPPDFLDLPRVVKVGQELGHKGALTSAGIGPSTTHWHLRFAGETYGVVLDSATGEPTIDESEAQYIADYNRQWDGAIAGLRRRFAPPPARSAVDDIIDFWPTPTDPSENSNPNPIIGDDDYGPGPQNAWDRGDMGAYERYQRGEATGDDCNRYGGC